VLPGHINGDHFENPGIDLVGTTIDLEYEKTVGKARQSVQFSVSVTQVQNPEATDQRYDELRKAYVAAEQDRSLENGVLGLIHRVSCGTLNSNTHYHQGKKLVFDSVSFETAHSWEPNQSSLIKHFFFFGDT